MISTWTTTRGTIPWDPAPGVHPMPLGRNLYHDSRNLAYPWKRTARTLTSPATARSPRRRRRG